MSAVAATILASIGVVTVSSLSTQAGATVCSPPVASHFISGTIQGQDGRAINAQVSLNAVDSTGQAVDANGCHSGAYTKTIWVNMGVTGDGSTATTGVTRTWSYSGLPANAVAVWIEVYTRTNLPKSCLTCDGPSDTHRYGYINRRAIKINTANVRLLAPLHCGLGGTTGTIQGYLRDKNGTLVTFDHIYAWSMLNPDGSLPLQGWGIARQKVGYYVLDTLASGQTYTVWAAYHGVTQKVYNVPVKSCGNTPLQFKATS